jgi:cell division protein FtsB
VAGQSSSSGPQQTSERSRLRVPARAPSLRTAAIIFIGLLILFRWLHLILALQIASTSRQIQIATEELDRIDRHNTMLVREISETESPAGLSERALEAGYGPRQPIYLQTNLPLARPAAGAWAGDEGHAASIGNVPALVPWEAATQDITVRAQADTAP